MCSGAIKDKDNYFGIRVLYLKKDEVTRKAIIAIARMMLVSIYHMILTGEVFKPSDYETFKNPPPSVKQQEFTEKSAIEFLKKYDLMFKLTKL